MLKKVLRNLVILLVYFLVFCVIISSMMKSQVSNVIIVILVLAWMVFPIYIFAKREGDFIRVFVNYFLSFVVLAVFTSVVPSPFKEIDNSYDDNAYTEDQDYTDNNISGENTASNGDNISDDYIDNSSDYLEGYTYSMSDISELNGYYRLNEDEQTLKTLPKNNYKLVMNYFNDGVNSQKSITVASSYFMPTTIDRTKGEKLVVVGEMGDYHIRCYTASLIGYSNLDLMLNVTVDSVENINGIDISNINSDLASVNSKISTTPFEVFHYSCDTVTRELADRGFSFVGDFYVSDTYGETFTYGSFEGTSYIETNVAMINPTYLTGEENSYTPSKETTTNGYFIIDLSELPEGYYVLYGYAVGYEAESQYLSFYLK